MKLIKKVSATRTAEAEIMDWADDVTYAVHDVEDFYRAGRIPLHRLNRATARDDRELQSFLRKVFKERSSSEILSKHSEEELERAFVSLLFVASKIDEPYAGTHEHRVRLRRFSAYCIDRFIPGIKLRNPTKDSRSCVEIDPGIQREVLMLKQLTWHYVIQDPAMASQRVAQRLVMRTLFECFHKATDENELSIFPSLYRDSIESATPLEKARLIIDLISSMTERQAIGMYQRVSGMSLAPTFKSVL